MGSYCLMGTGFQIGQVKKFWRQMVVMVAQQCECTECHRTVHWKIGKTVNFMLCIFYHNKNVKKRGSNEGFLIPKLLSKSCLPWEGPGDGWKVRCGWLAPGKCGKTSKHWWASRGSWQMTDWWHGKGVKTNYTCFRIWFGKIMMYTWGKQCV